MNHALQVHHDLQTPSLLGRNTHAMKGVDKMSCLNSSHYVTAYSSTSWAYADSALCHAGRPQHVVPAAKPPVASCFWQSPDLHSQQAFDAAAVAQAANGLAC